MYWPTATSRLVTTPHPLNNKEPIVHARSCRKGNFFATLTADGLGVWDVRPTLLQAAVIRPKASLDRFGQNVDVFWAHDGKGLIVVTDTSHLLIYQLSPSSRPSYDSAVPSTPGPGEGDVIMGWNLRSLGVAFIMGGCQSVLPQTHHLLVMLRHPPSILQVPWPIPDHLLTPPGSHFPPPPLDGESEAQAECDVFDLSGNAARGWIGEEAVPTCMTSHKTLGLPALHTMLTEDGRAYAVYQSSQLQANSSEDREKLKSSPSYVGDLVYPLPPTPAPAPDLTSRFSTLNTIPAERPQDKAVSLSINSRFGLVAIGLQSGKINVVSLPTWPTRPWLSHILDLRLAGNFRSSPGSVTSLSWTGDGYCLAAGYARGWAVWSMGGRLDGCGVTDDDADDDDKSVSQVRGVVDLFWIPGNLELFILRPPHSQGDHHHHRPQIEVVPFAKSATTNQASPDNTRYAFLQMDDRVLVYRGADQPDMSVINPESDVWQSIKIPTAYIATNWPIRYASISPDGKLIAVAGRRGLTHYSISSGRWKLFSSEREEQGFQVKGGLLWFHHVLIVAVDYDKAHQIRLYSRDMDLSDILHSQTLPAPVLVMTLLDNSLLVYTSDNTLFHFLILPTASSIRLHLCGSISFRGIIKVPSRVRAMSWLVPEAQKAVGNPADDLILATIIFLVDGQLLLLRPRRAQTDEVRYDIQTLATRIESYWTHLHGVPTLENSLWGYDGQCMRVWFDALTIEGALVDEVVGGYVGVEESVKIDLDFYPLSILMDKGIIIGVDYETSTRTLPFPVYKISTGTHLFLPQFLRYHLSTQPPSLQNALILAQHYQGLVYFGHALEVLLHSVLEDEHGAQSPSASPSVPNPADHPLLQKTIIFLDHFSSSPSIILHCARKTDISRWPLLFSLVGYHKPREFFERCLRGEAEVDEGVGWLLVLDGLDEEGRVEDTVRLLKLALHGKKYRLCKDLLRFLHSIDDTGAALQTAIAQVGIIDSDAQSISEDAVPGVANGHLAEPRPIVTPTTPTITLSGATPTTGNDDEGI